MDHTDDMDCLRAYALERSEPAFAAIVRRRINLVYSAALRQVGDASIAEDLTQVVFIALARKSAGLAGRDIVLSAWLLSATRLAALDARKRQTRRRKHEVKAATMTPTQSDEPDKKVWSDIRPLLDGALAKLGEKDRRAIVLRYFDNRSLREVGQAMGVTEEAARQRIWRAMEKLRAHFAAKGMAFPSATLATAIQANAVHPAPLALAGIITMAASTLGPAAAVSCMTKGAIYLMATTKTKIAAAAVVAAVLLGGTATTMVYVTRKPVSRTIVLTPTLTLEPLTSKPDYAPVTLDYATALKKCSSNLRQLGLGMFMYANAQKDGSLPPDIETLMITQDLSSDVVLDPRRGTRLPPDVAKAPRKQKAQWLNSNSDFLYFGSGRNNRIGTMELLAMEKPGALPKRPGSDTEEIAILFGDGHTEAWPSSKATELMEETKRQATTRPPDVPVGKWSAPKGMN